MSPPPREPRQAYASPLYIHRVIDGKQEELGSSPFVSIQSQHEVTSPVLGTHGR